MNTSVVKSLLIACFVIMISCKEKEKEVAPETAAISKTNLDYPIQPVPFTSVSIQDNFWSPRIETNRKVTIPYNFQKCEETGRLSNFAIAGGLEEGEFEGIYFNDSDVFKVIEGASYSLQVHEDPKLKLFLDDLIAKIAAAQEDDGYLYTNRTIDPSKAADGGGEKDGPISKPFMNYIMWGICMRLQ
ncbi:beta-L-arabinofuranosidase domain-containing protein [Maribacter halichondriae]|uniref:beta-L-arabinofuranosidase domain-containing protein n=1 Tax=Maribacter halichondriae TaxID=2980554 RepID=UPI002359C280|nr:beta-L-arabinofuranosidase domain-containing protein [Maribacter sp. Hal144]